jgi:hypothetical protein
LKVRRCLNDEAPGVIHLAVLLMGLGRTQLFSALVFRFSFCCGVADEVEAQFKSELV